MAAGWPTGSNTGVGCRASSIVGPGLDRHAGKPDGIASFTRLADEHGARWPSTFTVATPSGGGLHLYFRAGGYLGGPGSVTAAGRYVIAADVEVAPSPRWLSPLLPVAAKPGGQPVQTSV